MSFYVTNEAYRYRPEILVNFWVCFTILYFLLYSVSFIVRKCITQMENMGYLVIFM